MKILSKYAHIILTCFLPLNRDQKKARMLYIYAKEGERGAMHKALNKGASPDTILPDKYLAGSHRDSDEGMMTPLQALVQNDVDPEILLIIANKAEIEKQTGKYAAIHYAVAAGYAKQSIDVLRKAGADFHQLTKKGETLEEVAAKHGNKQMVEEITAIKAATSSKEAEVA